jgi:hypothetical protein
LMLIAPMGGVRRDRRLFRRDAPGDLTHLQVRRQPGWSACVGGRHGLYQARPEGLADLRAFRDHFG